MAKWENKVVMIFLPNATQVYTEGNLLGLPTIDEADN